MTVSRCRWMCGSPLSRMPQQSKLTGKPCLAAAAKARFKPGWSASIGRPSRIRMRMPRAWRRRPFRYHIVNRWIGRVDRRYNPKLIRIGVVNFERVARIVFIGAERRDHDRTVDADTVHRSDHLFACGGVESVRGTGPRPAGMISIEGMNLNVDDWHGRPPACSTNCPPS